ncbi:hypothetical protein CCP2SC5_30083 [Azospirillaceae bacterium]
MTDDKKNQSVSSKNGEAAAGAEGARYRFVQRQDPPDDEYADGAAGMIFGPNVVKVDFFRVVGFDSEAKVELRNVSHRLVLPISSIPELTRLFQGFNQVMQQRAAQASGGGAPGVETSKLN